MTTTRINTSVYPSGIDTDRTIPHLIDKITEVRSINFNSIKDAIISVELALGINPQGSYETVSDRLDGIATDFLTTYVSNTGDTITGPSDDEDGSLELDLGISVGMKMLYDDSGAGNDAARIIFGDECNCNVVLDDRSSESGTFSSPTTSTKWIPSIDEINDYNAISIVPLSILGNSAFSSDGNLHGLLRRIRIFDDMFVSRSLRVKKFIRAGNVDLSMDGLHYAGLKSAIARKAIVFSEDPNKNEEFNMQVGSNIYFGQVALRNKNRSNTGALDRNELIDFLPTQPSVFSYGNLSVDGDVEIQGSLFISDYMNVKAAQTAIDIDKVRVVVPAAEFKTNILMVTFSAIILDVTENNSRGGIYLRVNGKKIDHPMIYKGQALTSDDPYDELAAAGINVFPEAWNTEGVVVDYEDPVLGSVTRDRTQISPNGSYSGMSTMIMISDDTVSGVALDGSVPRFNPNEALTITMESTSGVSSIMHTVVVWATGATNMEIVTGWNSDGSPIKESWTPVM